MSASRLPCALLFAALLWLCGAAPGPLRCDPQELPDRVIDIGVAVAKGAHFTDPINAATAEECLHACCTERKISGDPSCNLAVYDTGKRENLPNCYMFLCPEPEACPLSPSPGVLSYSLWTENSRLENHDLAEDRPPKTQNSKDQSKPLSLSDKKPSTSVHTVLSEKPESEETFGQPGINKKKLNSSIEPEPAGPEEEPSQKDSAKEKPSSSIDLTEPEAEGPEKESNQKESAKNKPSSSIDLGEPDAAGPDKESNQQDLAKKKPSSSFDQDKPKAAGSVEDSSLVDSSKKKPSSALHPVSDKEDQAAKKKPSTNINPDTENSEAKDSGKESVGTPGHITSELLHLAQSIDKRLEKLEANSGKEKSSNESTLDLPKSPAEVGSPVPSSQDKEPKKVPPKDLDEDTGVLEKKSKIQEDHLSTPKTSTSTTTTTTTLRTSHKVTTTAQRTKPSLITSTVKDSKAANNVPSSDTKSIKSPPGRPGDSPASTVRSVPHAYPMTTKEVPTHHGKNLQPETPDDPSQTSKGAKSTIKEKASFTGQDSKGLNSAVVPPVSLNASKNLDSQGPFSVFSDRSGLVAALVFGVVFLVVIIGLISRKMTEARRRYQYTKLDYLINGMYVDT